MSASRLAEQLMALLRYELDDGRGCCAEELIDDVIGEARDAMICQFDGTEDLTAEQCEKITGDVLVLADHLVMAMVATGHADRARAVVESIAASRRRCDAKFGSPRDVPFSHAERDELAKEWDVESLASKAVQ